MTKEQLMQPRWKCIADYPQSIWKVGEILTDFPELWAKANLEPFPNIFVRLQWWEDRQESEMPEYVRAKDGQVFQIKDWDNFSSPYVFVDDNIHTGWWKKGCESIALYGGHIPATFEEYQQFKKLQDGKSNL